MRPYKRLGGHGCIICIALGLEVCWRDEQWVGNPEAILIDAVRKSGSRPALVVSPAGLIGKLGEEKDPLSALGTKLTRCHQEKERRQWRHGLRGIHVILTSYSTLARDIDWMSACPFGLVIADEAQHIKNRRTLHAGALRRLSSTGRFLLTGTPIENSIEDAVALFDFVMPGYVGESCRMPSGAVSAMWGRLKVCLAPYILRRPREKSGT